MLMDNLHEFVVDKKPVKTNYTRNDVFDESGKGFRIFVRGLPYDLTTSQLESHFEGIGPLKTCFIVTDRETRKSRGFGFVGYALQDDAETAIKTLSGKKLLGKTLQIEMAAEKGTKPELKKGKKNSRKERTTSTHKESTGEAEGGEEAKSKGTKRKRSEKDEKTTQETKKRKGVQHFVKSSSVLMVSGFKSNLNNKAVRRILKKFGPVNFILYPSPESQEDNCVAKVWYKFEQNAKNAYKRLSHGYENLDAKYLADTEKHYRLILRNLSFQCLQKTLEKQCRKHGELIEVVIPKRDDGGYKGFAFIQYKEPKDAKKALLAINSTYICSRQVAVDWCLGRETYQHYARIEEKKEKQKKESTNTLAEGDTKKEEEKVFEKMEEGKEEVETNNEEIEKNKEEEQKFLDDSDDEDEDEEEEEKSGEDKKNSEDKSKDNKTQNHKTNKEEKKVTKEKKEKDDKNVVTKIHKPKKSGDVAEGCTLFIRNLPFTVREHQLKKKFTQFGEVEYAKVVMDKKLDRPRGTAFVKFVKKSDATKVLKQYGLKNEQNSKHNKRGVSIAKQGLSMSQRPMLISLALERNSVKDLEKKFKEDKRNIYLLKEGHIDEDSPEAMRFSKVELERRKNSFQQRIKKLENPNFSVSRVRLSVQNLPANMEEKQLKALFHSTATALRKKLKYSCRQNMPKVTQVKVVRDKIRKDKEGKAKSKRFGFVQFREHQDALAVLKELNNSVRAEAGMKRLQIEFSIENERLLHVRKEKVKKNQAITKANLKAKKKAIGAKNDNKFKRKQKGKKRQRQEQAIDRMRVGKDQKNTGAAPPTKKAKTQKVKNVKREELKPKSKKRKFFYPGGKKK